MMETASSAADPLAAVPSVEKIDAQAVNAAARRSLYEKRRKIYPSTVRGRWRTAKWSILVATLGLYYVLPWIRWDRGLTAPDQAVLVDFPGRRFYFFFIEIWPQEIYYVTGLLVMAALTLFLVTCIAGRVWCGYACPQTVWTDLFLWVERLVEGDRNTRMRLDRAKWSVSKLTRRIVKHSLWLLIAICTGGAWVFYFGDAPTLAEQLLRFEAPLVSYVFIGILTFTTYMLAGLAREQVCTFMCPWPRIQGAMLDEHSMLVTYRSRRGEPRGSHKRGDSWEGRGDCIDCNSCVAACPMGIDIRDGNQLECINCALCVDACDTIMDRVGRPRGLIAYDTMAGLDAPPRHTDASALPSGLRLVRPRTILYSVLIVLVGVVMLTALMSRSDTQLSVLPDRNPLWVQLTDGSIRNGYTVKILNKLQETRHFQFLINGLPGASLQVVGAPDSEITSDPGRLTTLRAYVAVPPGSSGAPAEFDIVLRDRDSGARYVTTTTFRRPG